MESHPNLEKIQKIGKFYRGDEFQLEITHYKRSSILAFDKIVFKKVRIS
jgi:hypothetical protein